MHPVDYGALFAAVPSPILVLNPDLVIVAVNAAYCAVAGRTSDDLLGKTVLTHFPIIPMIRRPPAPPT